MRQGITSLALIGLLAPLLASGSEESVREALVKRIPGIKITSIRPAPIAGIYEVVVGGKQVFYTDDQAQFAFAGNVIDLDTKENLTQKRVDELLAVDFSRIPLDKAIVKVKGAGSRKLVVFSDPDCPYCRQLEKELAFVDDVTIYILLYPLESIHPNAREKAVRIWCSPNPAKAWDDLMLFGREPAPSATTCDTPIDQIALIGQSLFIQGTPGLVFQNGKVVGGAISAQEIEGLLKAASGS
jgi:thiol:disulfide interchange protein DsbC